jgi:hypothetical protein
MNNNPCLSVREAIEAMINGETLVYDGEPYIEVSWNKTEQNFAETHTDNSVLWFRRRFDRLYREQAPCRYMTRRYMTRMEAMGWVASANSVGWVARFEGDKFDGTEGEWQFPQTFTYSEDMKLYRRARLSESGEITDITSFWIEADENDKESEND